MTWEWVALACLALVAVGLGVALLRARSRAAEQQSASAEELAELRAAIDDVRRELAPQPAAPVASDDDEQTAHTITDLGTDPPLDEAGGQVERRLDGRLFADLVLREAAVKAGALAHGLRHGLSGETRNRIRYQMKLEVKRSRKHRKVELREARRLLAQMQRERMEADRAAGTGRGEDAA